MLQISRTHQCGKQIHPTPYPCVVHTGEIVVGEIVPFGTELRRSDHSEKPVAWHNIHVKNSTLRVSLVQQRSSYAERKDATIAIQNTRDFCGLVFA